MKTTRAQQEGFDDTEKAIHEMTLREHQSHAGRSRSAKKLAAVSKNLEKAWSKRKHDNPSPSALYQRARRAKQKLEKITTQDIDQFLEEQSQ